MTRGISRGPIERLCMPLAEWPETDRELWQAVLTKGTPFDDNGARADLRPATNRGVEKSYGRWLDFLDQHDRESLAVHPGARITRDRVRAYIAFLIDRGNHLSTVGLRIEQLRSAARAMDPLGNWDWMKKPASNLRQRSKPKRDKRERMVAASDLFQLGLKLMDEAPLQDVPGHVAVQYRDGLLIALLACVPLRLKNISELRLGASLRKDNNDWMINLAGLETKTHKPYETAWPAELAARLEHYLATYRPQLAARRRTSKVPAGDHVWTSAEGRPLSAKRINELVKLRTEAAFGRRVNPHLFRDAGATTMAIEDPSNLGVMVAVLGHAGPKTMERHYQQASGLQAQRAYLAGIACLRGGG